MTNSVNGINDLWNEIISRLSAELTATAIKTWFDDCTPVEITDDRVFIIKTVNEFKKKIISDCYSPKICSALSDIFSCDFELKIITPGNEQKPRPASALPEGINYSFDNFIVGNSNNIAFSAAFSAAKNTGTVYNPLFICGNSGLGKTHLLFSAGNYFQKLFPEKKIVYINGQDFINQVVSSIRDGRGEEFRSEYMSADFLLLDDVQFISGKTQTQNEFFHIFNNIFEAGKQIIITSDRPPRDMPLLEDRLRTRFEGGLIANIQSPDYETRTAIIRSKAEQLSLDMNDDAVSLIAQSITDNIRSIEGVIKRLNAYKEISGIKAITAEIVNETISDHIQRTPHAISAELIIKETARYFDIPESAIRSKSQSKSISLARQTSMYIMRSITALTLDEIGSFFGDRNYATVLSSVRKIEGLIKQDKSKADTINNIISNIKSL